MQHEAKYALVKEFSMCQMQNGNLVKSYIVKFAQNKFALTKEWCISFWMLADESSDLSQEETKITLVNS